MFTFIAGLVIGAVLAMRFAPKLVVTDGKITFEWSDKRNRHDPVDPFVFRHVIRIRILFRPPVHKMAVETFSPTIDRQAICRVTTQL